MPMKISNKRGNLFNRNLTLYIKNNINNISTKMQNYEKYKLTSFPDILCPYFLSLIDEFCNSKFNLALLLIVIKNQNSPEQSDVFLLNEIFNIKPKYFQAISPQF
uniref:Uncharacterized protein n=1 Tax=Heterorhabditis bacteriophora TaxID=37862 RepID=A0A1I7WAX8_HETBA